AAATRLDAKLDELARAIESMATLRPRIRRETEAELVRLALAIARRVLRRELTVDPDAIAGIVKAAFEKREARETLRVRVHPNDSERVARRLADAGAQVDVVADAALPSGGVILETARGALDASVDTQLAEIERGFADLLPQ
ncbi:MAG: FliH/SctL family protein, partial [Bryobacteraceae bacterium]